MTKSGGSCHDSSHPSLGASVQHSSSFWKDPCLSISSPTAGSSSPPHLCLQAQKAGGPWKRAPERRGHLLSLSSGTESPSLFPEWQYFPCSFLYWWWSNNSSSCPWKSYKFQLQLIAGFSNIIPLYPWISYSPLSSVLTSIPCISAFQSELSLHSLLPQDTDTWLGCSKNPGFWVHLLNNFLKCLKLQAIFHWRNRSLNLFLAMQK